ncbi:MAG: DUF1800 domain-containing protein [Shimia sp.]
MAGFNPILAAKRFGCGLSPRIAPPASVPAMMAALRGPDLAARAFPMQSQAEILALEDMLGPINRASKRAETEEARAEAKAEANGLRRTQRFRATLDLGRRLLRMSTAEDALRERLTLFWADHFTAFGKDALWRYATEIYIAEAIRPHVIGRFSDMLKAVVTHPVMLFYLDQRVSTGPNSDAGQRNNGRGLNENLAREILELHTLGVGGAYGQRDVRELAELLTGLTHRGGRGFFFRERMVEPGPETVLGVTYAGDDLAAIEAAMEDLAVHPDTARHLARKLAVHFVAEEPPQQLVDALAQAFAESGGDLAVVTEAMLSHPAAWAPELRNVKWPLEFIGSSFRALGVTERHLPLDDRHPWSRYVMNRLSRMGQPWPRPAGPDGWPEEDSAWITPQGLAARIDWAMNIPRRLTRALPDPRDFARTALGPAPPPEVDFAAQAAETYAEGVGLILSSPAFQRR